MDHLVDGLAKVVADRGSRRRLLRRMGAGLASVWLVSSLGAEEVGAAPDRCQVYCHNFGSGPRQAACLQACKKCGGDVSRVCFGAVQAVCCPADRTLCCGVGSNLACCRSDDYCCSTGPNFTGGPVCCPSATTFSCNSATGGCLTA